MLKKRPKRTSPNINAGSMADIAFLLLIFFLVATKIEQDKALTVILPKYIENATIKPKPFKNLLKIYINGQDELLVDGKLEQLNTLKDQVKSFVFISNKPNALKKDKAVIALQNDGNSSYKAFIKTYNELKKAFNELRSEYALENYGKSFEELELKHQKVIADIYPLNISESEQYRRK